MPSKRIQFRTLIKAPASVVWTHITSQASYRQWTTAFAEGSCFEGTWEQGSPIKFLAANGDGMLSEVAESRPCEFISIRHLGMINQGVIDTTSDAIRAWSPAYENYTLTPTEEGTQLLIDQDVSAEWEDYISQAWPKALNLLKALCEDEAPTASSL